MTSTLVLGTHIQGLIAAALLAKRGYDVRLVDFLEADVYASFFEEYKTGPVAHIPLAIPHDIIDELGLESYGVNIAEGKIDNPFKKLPFYDGLKTIVDMLKSLEHSNLDYKEKAWRDAWGTFEIGRILSGYDDNIQSLFAKSSTLSLVDLVKASDLSDSEQAEIIAICTLGAKTDPDASGSAASILSGMAVFEQEDCAYFYGSIHNLYDALKQACMSAGVHMITEQHIENINTEGKEISSVSLSGGEVITADYYVLDFDPVTFFKKYLNEYSILPAFKNRIIPKQNVKECIHGKIVLGTVSDNLRSPQIIASSVSDVLSARSDMKKDGGAQKPVLSVMPIDDIGLVQNGKIVLDVVAQYFDPAVESSDDAKKQSIMNALETVFTDVKAHVEHIEIIPMATQFGQPTFMGTMPLLQLFKIFFGHHSLAYDMPINNLLVCGYGELCASHHHIHRGGERVASLLQSL